MQGGTRNCPGFYCDKTICPDCNAALRRTEAWSSGDALVAGTASPSNGQKIAAQSVIPKAGQTTGAPRGGNSRPFVAKSGFNRACPP